MLFFCLAVTYVSFVSCFRPEPEIIEHEDKFGLRTENVTAHVCPFLCILNGKCTCVPPPQCPLPPCVDATKKPLECCKYCPNGPNCGKDGVIIPLDHSKMIDGQNCTCVQPFDVECH